MDQIDCVVVGAGVVGLAVARAIALTGVEVLVLEAADDFGTGISSRNSEVIHSGLYYPTHSLKAQLCLRGQHLLYDYCTERAIAHERCGKLVVATSESQLPGLEKIALQAVANGVHDLRMLTREHARELEPNLECMAALLCPNTGILDSHAFMLSLLGDLERAGGMLALKSALDHAVCRPDGIELCCKDGTQIFARKLVNSAGLGAPALARRFAGLSLEHVPQSLYAKGNYFSLAGPAPFQRLIYPVPEPGGLGIHLTLDLGHQARFGPDVEWVNSELDLTVSALRAPAFYEGVRRYWPGLPDGALSPGYAGIRPKLHGPGEVGGDFVIQGREVHGIQGLVNLFGIESPGLTSAMAMGERVREMLVNS